MPSTSGTLPGTAGGGDDGDGVRSGDVDCGDGVRSAAGSS